MLWLLLRGTHALRKVSLSPGPQYMKNMYFQGPVSINELGRLQPAPGLAGSLVWGRLRACWKARLPQCVRVLGPSTCRSLCRAPCKSAAGCLLSLVPTAVTLWAPARVGQRLG